MKSFFALPPKNVVDRHRRETQDRLRLAITWIERNCHHRRRQRRPGKLSTGSR